MAKKYYVDGNIAVMTPYFICKDCGAGSGIPENADILKTNDVIDGDPILIIDDDRPQSIFDEYYATGEFSDSYIGASYLYLTYIDCYQNYNNDINQVKSTLNEINQLSDSSQSILYKTLYINIVTILDSFLCSIILSRIITDEVMFKEYYKKQIPSHIHKSLEHYLIDDQKAKWEQEYIKEVLKGSYYNTPSKPNKITIKPIDSIEIINRLKTEIIYENADLKFETVNIEDLYFLNPYIRALKYKQIDKMYELYESNQIEPFTAAALYFGKKESIICPPVAERHNDKLYIIEGNTRCVYAYRHGIRKLKIIVANNVTTPIPCDTRTTYKVSDVLISDTKITAENRYQKFDYSHFRHIEESIRPHKEYML